MTKHGGLQWRNLKLSPPSPLARTKQKFVCRGLGTAEVSLGAAWVDEKEPENLGKAIARFLKKPAVPLEWSSSGRTSGLFFKEVIGNHTTEATPGAPHSPNPFTLYPLTLVTRAIYHPGWCLSPWPQVGVMAAPWCHRGVTWAQDWIVGSFGCGNPAQAQLPVTCQS